jgi:rSAM/selenodomain-associated transferase 2
MNGQARISVVIPFLDEERALPATLARLFSTGKAIEAIAVDGGSADRSRTVLGRYPVRIVDAPRGRAEQMNAGAKLASGELLLFLHADTLLSPGALDELAARLHHPQFQWGGFRHAFSNADWRLRLISRLHNLRCRATGVFYGDQCMFVRRDLFERAGGFPLGRMEDIALSERLRRECAPTLLASEVVTDSRKFVRMGVWRSLGRVAAILVCRQFHLPIPRAFFADVR